MKETSFNISFPIDFWTRYRASLTLMHRLWGTWLAYAFFVGFPTLAFIAAYIFDWDLSEPGAFDLPVCYANAMARHDSCLLIYIEQRG